MAHPRLYACHSEPLSFGNFAFFSAASNHLLRTSALIATRGSVSLGNINPPMRRSKFTPEQVALALRQAESGTPVAEICRKLEVTENTFYRWKKKFGGLGTPEIRELRQLREENRKLKTLVADLSLDKTILQESLRKKW